MNSDIKKLKLSLEEPINIIDIGSDAVFLKKITNLLLSPSNIYCIDPNEKYLNGLQIFFENKNKVNFKKFNFGISDKAGKKIFYITKVPQASSLYEPNYEIINRYRRDNIFDLIKKEDIECKNLEDFILNENIRNVDLLSLCIQSSELDAIKGAGKNIEKVSIIYSRVEFIKKYKNQPIFDDFVSYLRLHNFRFVGFKNDLEISGKKIESIAIFLNEKFSNNNVIKAATILISMNLYWEAKWILLDYKFDNSIYFDLIKLHFQKEQRLLKFLLGANKLIKRFTKKIGILEKIRSQVTAFIKKTEIGKKAIIYSEPQDKK